jgi:hypothetical protein
MTLKQVWASGDADTKRGMIGVVIFWLLVVFGIYYPTLMLPVLKWVGQSLAALFIAFAISIFIYGVVSLEMFRD